MSGRRPDATPIRGIPPLCRDALHDAARRPERRHRLVAHPEVL